MCFYDLITFQCDPTHFKWGTFRASCARSYRNGEKCSRRSAYPTLRKAQPMPKCRTCDDLETAGALPREKPDSEPAGTNLDCLEPSAKSPEKSGNLSLVHVQEGSDDAGQWRDHQRRHDEWMLKKWQTDQRIGSASNAKAYFPESSQLVQYGDIRKVFDMVVLRSMITGLISIDTLLRPEFDRAYVALRQHAQTQQRSGTSLVKPKRRTKIEVRTRKPIQTHKESETPKRSEIYPRIDLCGQEIRLFEMTSASGSTEIHGKFHITKLSESPTYAALSYTWGDIGSQRMITMNGKKLAVGGNLWHFLHHRTAVDLATHRFLWIDAICIDQQDVSERNHQVGLMREIYSKASVVVIWLGRESNDSNVAMEYVAKKGLAPLKPKGPGYRALWTRAQGKALYDLCFRPYWRRVWIIQEILNAQEIVVMCGTKRFEWRAFESLYHKAKVLDLRGWIFHHEFATGLLEGPAMTTVWQRAHYRHPDTPAPLLQELLKVFQDWQCSDSRDKVYGLLGLVGTAEIIAADYSLTGEGVYGQVVASLRYSEEDDGHFCKILRRSLKLPPRKSSEVKIRGNRYYYQDDWPRDIYKWIGGRKYLV